MFISDFVHIAVPFCALAPVLLDENASWLRHLEETTTRDARFEGDQFALPGAVTTKVRVGVGGSDRARPSPSPPARLGSTSSR